MNHWLLLCTLVCVLLLPPTLSARSFPGSYDPIFRDATERYMFVRDWHWLKAQCYQESLLNPKAVSHVGAQGVCQFMPATWRETTAKMGIHASPFNPRANILAAGFYMRQLNSKLTVRRTDMERLRWAWSSYNAGFGTTLRAQRRSGGSPVWADIAPYMPAETRTYVIRIERWHREMKKPFC